MEGIGSEAASLAGHLRLGKLKLLYDDNHITIEGDTALAFDEDVEGRFRAYGWHVARVADANDLEALDRAFREAEQETSRPSLVISRSHIGYPAPHKMDTADAHGSPLGENEVRATKEILGWDPDAHFAVPPESLARWREAGQKSAERRKEWRTVSTPTRGSSRSCREFHAAMDGRSRPAGTEIPSFSPASTKDGKLATRKASGKTLNAIAKHYPALAGGSADLAPSTDTLIAGESDFEAAVSGRNFHWGVREHAMGSALNGMAAHGGVRPFGATFFIFSDYMRPAVRLAALSELPVIYVWTHDSIGLGEDGPTHQPIEHLASFRAMPGVVLIRPADANETAQAWKAAIAHTEGPVGLVLTAESSTSTRRSTARRCASIAVVTCCRRPRRPAEGHPDGLGVGGLGGARRPGNPGEEEDRGARGLDALDVALRAAAEGVPGPRPAAGNRRARFDRGGHDFRLGTIRGPAGRRHRGSRPSPGNRARRWRCGCRGRSPRRSRRCRRSKAAAG
jgi:transketolase